MTFQPLLETSHWIYWFFLVVGFAFLYNIKNQLWNKVGFLICCIIGGYFHNALLSKHETFIIKKYKEKFSKVAEEVAETKFQVYKDALIWEYTKRCLKEGVLIYLNDEWVWLDPPARNIFASDNIIQNLNFVFGEIPERPSDNSIGE